MTNDVEKLKLVKNFATTGLLTDYFDEKKIKYDYLGNFLANDNKAFSIGKVRTIVCETGPFIDENIHLGLGYLDRCDPNDLLIVRGSSNFAYFGELMSRLSSQRKLSGAVIIGATRDNRFTNEIFPVWANKYMPIDIKGRGRVKSVGKSINAEDVIITEDCYAAIDADGLIIFKCDFNLLINDLTKLIRHEQMLKDIIEKDYSVKDILKVTKSF